MTSNLVSGDNDELVIETERVVGVVAGGVVAVGTSVLFDEQWTFHAVPLLHHLVI